MVNCSWLKLGVRNGSQQQGKGEEGTGGPKVMPGLEVPQSQHRGGHCPGPAGHVLLHGRCWESLGKTKFVALPRGWGPSCVYTRSYKGGLNPSVERFGSYSDLFITFHPFLKPCMGNRQNIQIWLQVFPFAWNQCKLSWRSPPKQAEPRLPAG